MFILVYTVCKYKMLIYLKHAFFGVLLSSVSCATGQDTRPELLSEQTVRQFYPGYFRTSEEQGKVQRLWQEAPVSTVRHLYYSYESCNFTCREKSSDRQLSTLLDSFRDESSPVQQRSLAWTDHGCCRSRVAYTSPASLEDCHKHTRTLLQYASLRQYLPDHECRKYSSCFGCTCRQEKSLHQAVVLKPGIVTPIYVSDTELVWFCMDGCCKCVT